MNSKFKEGDKVSIRFKGKEYLGKVYIIDNMPNGFRYDVMCSEPEKVVIKHCDEDKLQKS